MKMRPVTERIAALSAIDWDRRLFDSLIPLPDGTSYNAYLVRGSEKIALLDTVDTHKTAVLMEQLEDVPHIDYIVAHHAEPDHSGALSQVLAKYPQAQVVVTPKGQAMLMDQYSIPAEQFLTVADGATLSLGDCTLEFIHAPWVHWPETMLTYLREERALFTCDFLGSHLATTNLYVTDEARTLEAAKRYYAEIMMPFRKPIEKHLARLADYELALILPSHGPIYPHPDLILNAYREWVLGAPQNLVVLPYVSMHGNTRQMVEYLIGALTERGVEVQPFDLTVTDIGKLAMALVDAATLVVGTPTVLGGPHPSALYAAALANALKPKLKYVSIVGSYGWGGGAVEKLAALIPNLRAEVLPPVTVRGRPRAAEFQALTALAETIAAKHQSLGLA